MLPAVPRDHYATLEIPRTATPDEVRRAYKRLVLRYHPDRNNGSEAAAAHFRAVIDAYQVLGNAPARLRYDSTSMPTDNLEKLFVDFFGSFR